MKNKFLPWFLLFCALGLSSTAAYYSVLGLSIVFTGVAIPVIVMGSFLEVSKIAIATYLHNQWKKTYTLLKIYLTIALIILSVITSIGIYGLLSTGFTANIAQLEIGSKEIANIEVKKQRFEEIKQEYTTEKQNSDNDISQLRESLATGTMSQYVDRATGQMVTYSNSNSRKLFQDQLNLALANRDTLSLKIDALNDSITNLDIQILSMESAELEGNELGAIKYVSEITGMGIKEVANWFIFILIFVFDPLAITLVIATNQAFNNLKPRFNIYGEEKSLPQEAEGVKKESKPKRDKTPPQTPTDPPQPIPENEYQKELDRINKSGYSTKKRIQMVNDLNQKIKNSGDNVKEY